MKNTISFMLAIFVSLIVSLIFIQNSYAFKIFPMSATIGVNPDNKSTIFFLENETESPIAVQVSLTKREMDLYGVEANPKIEEELTVYPTQLIIPGHEKRSVQVVWSGKAIPVKELSYRFIAEQLPIDLEVTKSKKASIKVLLKYIAALYVNADNYNSSIVIEDIKKTDKEMSLQVANVGKKHQVFSNLNLQFIDEKNKKEISLKPEDLKGMNGENILADSKRIFIFPKNEKINDINLSDKVKISFDKD